MASEPVWWVHVDPWGAAAEGREGGGARGPRRKQRLRRGRGGKCSACPGGSPSQLSSSQMSGCNCPTDSTWVFLRITDPDTWTKCPGSLGEAVLLSSEDREVFQNFSKHDQLQEAHRKTPPPVSGEAWHSIRGFLLFCFVFNLSGKYVKRCSQKAGKVPGPHSCPGP